MNSKSLSEQVVEWTREWFAANDRKTAVIGISGGKDSAVAAAICAKALGPEHVIGVMMPQGFQADQNDSKKVIESLGIRSMEVNIGTMCADMRHRIDQIQGVRTSDEAFVNIQPRIRMGVLYAIAQSVSGPDGEKACVVGTGNLAESMVGYTTKGGDSMCDMNPLGNLWVDDVIRVGDELGCLYEIIHKAPSDGLCGKTDEERLGFTYEQVKLVFTDRGDEVPQEIRDAIRYRYAMSAHKRRMPDTFPNGN